MELGRIVGRNVTEAKFRCPYGEYLALGEIVVVEDAETAEPYYLRVFNITYGAEASGEFTGVMRMTARGAGQFLDYFDTLHAKYGDDGIFAEDRPFRMSYLIHQLDSMISSGIEVQCVGVPGQYHEIDTLEDYDLARQDWTLSAGT